MNKVFCRKRRFFSYFPAGCLILFNLFLFTACGLDTFYEIEPSVHVGHEPHYDSIDEAEKYFEFTAVSSARAYHKNYGSDKVPPIKFLGVEVYYKIYDNYSRLNSEYSSIMQTQNKDNSSDQAAARMITTYRFQPLRTTSQLTNSVLILEDDNKDGDYDEIDHKVRIRLVDYLPFEEAQVKYKEEGTGTDEYGKRKDENKGIPVRSIPNNPTFDFFSQSADLRPKSDDIDTSITSSGDPDAYYVSMFAVSIGQDSGYIRIYSNVLYLGSVKIEK